MNRSIAYALGILLVATAVIVVIRTGTGDGSMTQAETVDPHEPPQTNEKGSWKHTNALARESSPYLLQHAHNPVNWYPWGPEAFELARRTGKPIFLSVGYSTCYWCHVMERQVFEVEKIAALMNEHFVNIKVDREERPDVDDIYMLAVQMMTQGRGGWPMSVFLTPPGARAPDDQGLKPFYAGTYFPPEPRHGMPGFPQVVQSLAKAWKERRSNVLQQADSVATTVAGYLSRANEPGPVNAKMVETVTNQMLGNYDQTHGGFGGAPKFPQPDNLSFLLEVYHNNPNEELWKALSHTLDRMARGGMYDQIGGGFHRYSTDEKWLVPHFEKMLYDNGQLLETYCAAQAIKAPDNDPEYYTRLIRHICEYVLREMTDPTGTFWSAQDAEVDAREGGNYVWTSQELADAIGDKTLTRLASRMYGFEEGTNFRDPHDPDADRVNVVFLPTPLHELAESQKITLEALLDRKAEIDTRLFKVRSGRKQPSTDDKVVVSWNGLMIAGMAQAGRTLDEPRYTGAAAMAASYILDDMRTEDGGLYRTMRQGRKKIPGFLDDYAFFAHGLLELYRSDRTQRWLDAAAEIVKIAREHFAAESGGYFDTLEGQSDLFVRTRGKSDGALPSGNSQMVHDLLDLHELTGEKAYLDQAVADLKSFSVDLKEQGTGMIHMYHALLRAVEAAPKRFTERGGDAGADQQPVRVRVEPDSVKPTEQGADIRVIVDVDEPYHINAHDVVRHGPVPTRLGLRQGQGLTLDIKYPPGRTNRYGFAEGPVNVYEGTVVIEATLRRSGEAPGAVPRLTMTYQACTDRACLEPKTVELPVQIVIPKPVGERTA